LMKRNFGRVAMRKVHGRSVGAVIERVIYGAKRELMIATPFISLEYAEALLDKASEGVRVKLVTSKRGNDERALEALEEPEEVGFVYPVALSGLGALSMMMGVTLGIPALTYLGLPAFLLSLLLGGRVRLRRRENIEIRYAHRVEPSIYLNEREGVVGRVPLKPVEVWERLSEVYVLDEEELEEMRAKFEELWRTSEHSEH